jgi:hypothetical protein
LGKAAPSRFAKPDAQNMESRRGNAVIAKCQPLAAAINDCSFND